MLKRILSLLITLAMCAGMITIPAMAEGEETVLAPVFYEGETFYSEDFTYETTADFDTESANAKTAKEAYITLTGTNYAIVDGTLVGSYDKTNKGDRICLSLGSDSLASGKYAIEYELAMENGEYFPKRIIGRPWIQYLANETDTKISTKKVGLSTFGFSSETNSQFLFGKTYKDYVEGEFYKFKFVIDIDNNKYYAYFEDELLINGAELFDLDMEYTAYPFDLVVQSATKQGVYDYKNIIDNVKFYRVYTEDELSPFTLTSSTIENGATEVLAGGTSSPITVLQFITMPRIIPHPTALAHFTLTHLQKMPLSLYICTLKTPVFIKAQSFHGIITIWHVQAIAPLCLQKTDL